MKDDIINAAADNIKKAQKRQKKNYDIRHSGNKTKLEIGDMVVKEIQVSVSHKGGRLEKKRESTYYVIEEFLSNGSVMLHDLHMNKIDPVPIPAGHLKKISPENEANSDNDKCTQDKYGKRKWNTISSMSTNTITNIETNNRELNGVRMSNTNMTPNKNMNVTSIDTSNDKPLRLWKKTLMKVSMVLQWMIQTLS